MPRTPYQEHLGVGEPSRAFLRLAGTSRKRAVQIQEGKRAGKTAGFQTDHWDGRVDATVTAPALNIKVQSQEIE